jgi:hypothetical protein
MSIDYSYPNFIFGQKQTAFFLRNLLPVKIDIGTSDAFLVDNAPSGQFFTESATLFVRVGFFGWLAAKET